MRDVLITGGTGQIGIELCRIDWGNGVRIHRPTRDELEISSADSVARWFERHEFAAVINTAAFTAVDHAESQIGAAFAANALGPALLAEATAKTATPLIHISTDYVFDGAKAAAYTEDDAVAPLGVYGASKLAGELAVRSGNPKSVVLRTAWVLSPHRSNFLKTMLRLSALRPEINVVADQVGCPTSAGDIAAAIRAIVLAHWSNEAAPVGVYHFVNAGDASWCDLANAIFAQGVSSNGVSAVARPITTADFPTAARRPSNSRLATAKISCDFGVTPRSWRDAIVEILAELKSSSPNEGKNA